MKKIFNIPPGGSWWMVLALTVTCSSWAQENRQAFLERVAQPRTTKGWIDFNRETTSTSAHCFRNTHLNSD